MHQNNEKNSHLHSKCHFHLSYMHRMTQSQEHTHFENAQEVLWKCKKNNIMMLSQSKWLLMAAHSHELVDSFDDDEICV